jgi:Flp pilus assembly protein TadD
VPTLLVAALAMTLGCASSGPAPEPVRSVAAPGLTPEPADASIVPDPAVDAGVDSDPSESLQQDGAPVAAPVIGLARGTGTPSDQALAVGDEAYLQDRWDEAQKAYVQAARLAPKDPAPIVGQVRTALAKADAPTDHAAAPNHAGLRQAVGRLRQALRLDAHYGPAHLELGRALLVMDQAEEAVAALRQATRLLDRDPEAHSALGVALLATGKGQEAVTALRRSVELDPDNVARQTNLATALLLRGHAHEAARVLERTVALAPDQGRVRTDLGTAYLAMQDLKRALPHLQKAVELDPNRATFRSNLGYALQLANNHSGAIEQYRKAIALDPKLGSAWINLGTALAQTGKRPEARQAFERAIALDPTDPRPRANLQELDELEQDAGK